ncbi:hypothetical protein SAMN06272759_103315 [Novosphingobium sp. B1]|nr:hypothetical protein SAMN06272759_103315 [Novosphingobium sp. B1]
MRSQRMTRQNFPLWGIANTVRLRHRRASNGHDDFKKSSQAMPG